MNISINSSNSISKLILDSEPLRWVDRGIPDLQISAQNRNDNFELNNAISTSQLFSSVNYTASHTDFMSKYPSLYNSDILKTTRSGLVYDSRKADTIIGNFELCSGTWGRWHSLHFLTEYSRDQKIHQNEKMHTFVQ